MAKSVALGTKLYMESAAGPPIVYTAVGNLTSISVPGPTRAEIDVTDFDSTGAEFLGGLPDNGTISFSGFYNPTDAGQDLMYTAANDPVAAIKSFRIDFTNATDRFTFSGYVASFVPTAGGPGEAYRFDGSIRVTGAVVKSAIT